MAFPDIASALDVLKPLGFELAGKVRPQINRSCGDHVYEWVPVKYGELVCVLINQEGRGMVVYGCPWSWIDKKGKVTPKVVELTEMQGYWDVDCRDLAGWVIGR